MPLTLDRARTLIAGGREHARGRGLRVVIAAVDEGGPLQALERMDGASPLSAQIAESKAAGAAGWERGGVSTPASGACASSWPWSTREACSRPSSAWTAHPR